VFLVGLLPLSALILMATLLFAYNPGPGPIHPRPDL